MRRRDLYPPGTKSPLTQYPGGAPGGIAQFSEVIEASDGATIDGGYIVPATLPVNAVGKSVYPYDYIRVNTLLNVVHDAGRRTAWIDKQLGHIWVAGPGGAGCDDCFFPSQDFFPGSKTNVTTSNTYEQSKMTALLNQIKGCDRTGSKAVGVPAFFGATFQIVSAMQKYGLGGGYNTSFSTPTPLTAAAFRYMDGYMGKLMTALEQAGLRDSTAIVVCAKYGNAPVNPTTLRKIKINWSGLVANITGNPNGLVFIENDDVALLWLNGTRLGRVVGQALATTYFNLIGAQQVLYGKALRKMGFNDPLMGDNRVPDVIIKTIPGVIYTGSSTKISEHGGFSQQDRSVALLVYHPSIGRKVTTSVHVSARSVAPSILKLLGLNPNRLTSSEVPGILPGLAGFFDLKTSA